MEAIGQLTGGVAHDFNNLLTVIIGNLETIWRQTPADNGRLHRAIDQATRGAQRAATLTQQLLAFARRQPLNPKPTDVNRLVADMTELLRRTLGESIAIETVLGGGLWRVEVDPHQLENALLNLAVNSRDAMPSGGRLTIETANAHLDERYTAGYAEIAPGQYVVICVSDTGTGMTKEVDSPRFRAVLHDEADRSGNRPGPEPGLRFREAVRRTRQTLQRAGPGDDGEDLSAATRRADGGRAAATDASSRSGRAGETDTGRRGRRRRAQLQHREFARARVYRARSIECDLGVARASKIIPRSVCCSPMSGCRVSTVVCWSMKFDKRRPERQGAVYDRLRAQCNRAPRSTRPRRRATHQTVHPRAACQPNPGRARSGRDS